MIQMHNNVRDQEVERFETIIDDIKWVGVKSFFEQFPDYADFYKKFKKDVETYRYASDEHIYTHHDKAVGEIKLERNEIILVDLIRREFILKEKVEVVLRRKRIEERKLEDAKRVEKAAKNKEKQRQRTLKMVDEWFAEGKITQERYDELSHPDFNWDIGKER